MVGSYDPAAGPPFAAGVTRVSDIVPLFSNIPIGVFDMSGTEVLEMARRTAGKGPDFLIIAGLDGARVEAARIYRIALPINMLWHISSVVQPPPDNYRLTGLDTGDAIERLLK